MIIIGQRMPCSGGESRRWVGLDPGGGDLRAGRRTQHSEVTGCHWGWSGGPGLCPPCSQLRALEHLLRFHLVCREIGIIIVPTHKPAGALQTARQVMCCTQRRAHSKHSVNVCGRHRY